MCRLGNWGKKVKRQMMRYYIMGPSGNLERPGFVNRKEDICLCEPQAQNAANSPPELPLFAERGWEQKNSSPKSL